MIKIKAHSKVKHDKMAIEIVEHIRNKINNDVVPAIADNIRINSNNSIDPVINNDGNNWTIATYNPNHVEIENRDKMFERVWKSIPFIISDSFK